MLYRIADLIVEIPAAGGLSPRCQEYLYTGDSVPADIVIREDEYCLSQWEGLSYESSCYLESGFHFAYNLLRFDGMMLHASAVAIDGKAYLFSGPSTVGKSTHTRLWQKLFGEAVQVFNDDKPALRLLDGQWFAYGTPWCGKDGINKNMKVPLAGICFLRQGQRNHIRRLEAAEAIPLVLSQTANRARKEENVLRMLSQVDRLIRMVPIFELENLPEEEAARLSYETMSAAANQ